MRWWRCTPKAIVETLCEQVLAAAGSEATSGGASAWRAGAGAERRGGRGAESAAAEGRDACGRCWRRSCASNGIEAPVTIVNDADGFAAGIAATHGQAGQHDPGVDAGRGHRLWALSDAPRACGRAATRW